MKESKEEEEFEVNKTLLKYKIILKKELGYKGKDIAKMMGIKLSTYYSMTRNKNRALPKWVKAFVVIHEILEQKHRVNSKKTITFDKTKVK